MKKYEITGMTCDMCRQHIEKAVRNVSGVDAVSVSLLAKSMTVEGEASDKAIIKAVEEAGYQAKLFEKDEMASVLSNEKEIAGLKKRFLWSVVFLVLLMYLSMGYTMLDLPLPALLEGKYLILGRIQMVLALAVLAVNRKFITSGIRALSSAMPNMDTLVALGAGVSFFWSCFILAKMTGLTGSVWSAEEMWHFYRHSLYFESAAMIPALITIGKLLEAYTKGRATDSLRYLMELSPRRATIEKDGKEIVVPAEKVNIGDIFIVRPGEIIPADGHVIEGNTTIDESTLTGESMPADKTIGDTVRAATVNQFGMIRVMADHVGEQTAFAQMVDLVMAASVGKAPVSRLADKVSSIFVPAIIVLSIGTFIGWLCKGVMTEIALEHAISVLVISCPCALGLATPVAIMAGSGIAARKGILFKNGTALEICGKLKTVLLDKTGTITAGKPQVIDICPASPEVEVEFFRYAYGLEKLSEHPMAVAIVAECENRRISAYPIQEFKAVVGYGLEGVRGPFTIHGGSSRYIEQFARIPEALKEKEKAWSKAGKTVIYFEKSGELLGMMSVADVIKGDSVKAVADLHQLGLHVVMLTGDNERTAKEIGKIAGITQIMAEVLPHEKEEKVKIYQEQGPVAMVGDGINDAPAMASADIGIAIGSGSDIAIDSSDVVLMKSRLTDVAKAIYISRKTLTVIHQNLFWAFAYNIFLIPMAMGLYSGLTVSPMWAAAAMALSSVTVCFNALRLNRMNCCIENENPTKLKKERKEEKRMEKIILVEGMTCEHCENTVKKALEEIDGIEKAEASHETKQVTLVTSKEIPEDILRKVIEEKGYQYKGIK